MNLKKQLHLFMDHWGMSAARLARQTGVSKQVISLWLAGGSPRKLDQLKKVAEALGTTIDHLCYGEGLLQPRPPELSINEEHWVSGVFEVKIRRIPQTEKQKGKSDE